MTKNQTTTMRLWALTWRECMAYANNAASYVVMVPFVLVTTYLYFSTALRLGDANLRPFFELLPWFLLVIGPAVMMRAFSEEYRKDTIELLFAHPVSEWQIVFAKFLGGMAFMGLLLASTFSLPISLLFFSRADVGVVITQYLSGMLVAGLFVAIGLMTSAYFRNAISSFLVGVFLNFVLLLIGLNFIVLSMPWPFNRILVELGMQSHLLSLSRGVVDVRDVLYFVSLTLLALIASVIQLSSRKLVERPLQMNRLWLAMGLVVAIGVLGNIAMMRVPIRIDLTANQRYSLSSGARQLLANLEDTVSLTLYTSTQLPGPMQVTLREASDRLRDFAMYSNGKVRLSTKVVSGDQASIDQATQAGMREVQFNQVGAGSLQVQTGFLGLHVRYGEKTEVIPFIADASDLEYQLARMVYGMTRDEKGSIGIMQLTDQRADTLLRQYLEEQYELVEIRDGDEEALSGVDGLLVIDDGSAEHATAAAMVTQYANDGGSVLALVDGVTVNQEFLLVTPSLSKMTSAFSDYGILVEKRLVYDLQLNEPIALGEGQNQFILAYPFWTRGLIDQQALSFMTAVNNVLFGWPSELTLAPTLKEDSSLQPLIVSGKAAGSQEGTFTIRPEELEGLEDVSGVNKVYGAVSQTLKGQKLIVLADSNWVSDEFLRNTQENQALIRNLVDLVAADELLSSIPKRSDQRSVYTFANQTQVWLVQYSSLILPSVVVAGAGLWWLHRRRRMMRREYEKA